MKHFAFVSDFDNTISKKDFYKILIDKYLGEEGENFYKEWKKTKKINVEFLNEIFASVGLTEEQLKAEILKIPLDESAIDFIKNVKTMGNDFYIVSAGSAYYVDILFNKLGIKGVNIISMQGAYENGKLVIHKDFNNPYYSEVFGLDKKKVVESLKNKYIKIYYAGDSEPDLEAAKIADICFAKGELVELLAKEGIEFIRFEDFSDINEKIVTIME